MIYRERKEKKEHLTSFYEESGEKHSYFKSSDAFLKDAWRHPGTKNTLFPMLLSARFWISNRLSIISASSDRQ
jgi:hypothetical protein